MMKLHGVTLVCTIMIAWAAPGAADDNRAGVPLETTRDQASYAIGLNVGRNLKPSTEELNVAALLRGIQDILTERQPSLTAEQCDAAVSAFERVVTAKMEQKGEANRLAGQAYLTANKRKAGVVTLPSGLQYQVLKKGTGPSPEVSDTVRTHYHGTLINGTVFDSSVERGEPAVFPVGGVIRGWTEALQRMRVGGKWRLFIPAELAYGNRNVGSAIGPNSVLVFDIELLGIE